MWRIFVFQSQSAHQSVLLLGAISSSCGVHDPSRGVRDRSAGCGAGGLGSSVARCVLRLPARPAGAGGPSRDEVQSPSWVQTGCVLQNLGCLLVVSLQRPPLPGRCSCPPPPCQAPPGAVPLPPGLGSWRGRAMPRDPFGPGLWMGTDPSPGWGGLSQRWQVQAL